MAATATIQILGKILNLLGVGEIAIGPVNITSADARGERRSPLNLASGSNTVLVPTGTTALLFIPPIANAQTITLKPGDGTGTGIPLSKTQPTLLAFDPTAPPASINLTTGGIVNACEVQFV